MDKSRFKTNKVYYEEDNSSFIYRYVITKERMDYKFPLGDKNVLSKIHKGNWEFGTLNVPLL